MKLRHDAISVNQSKPGLRSTRNGFVKAALLSASIAAASFACTTQEEHHHYITIEPPATEQPQDPCPPPVASLSCRAPRIGAILGDGQNIRVGDRLVSFEGDSDFDGQVLMKVTDRNCEVRNQGNAVIGEQMAVEGVADGITITVLDAEARSVEVEISLPLVIAGVLNQGEGLLVPSTTVSLRLDDLSTAPSTEPPSALLSVRSRVGEEDITIDYLDVREGTAEPFAISPARYSVGAPVVSPGTTFAANRAELEVFRCDE
ncbi:MAG: hypothetical protein V1861_05775 [Candidatus Micrarchaeota archaeon]